MKKIFSILFTLFHIVSFSQNSYRINPNTAAASINNGYIALKVTPVSNIKYPKTIGNYLSGKRYTAFGNMIRFANSDSVILFNRAGTGHLTGGVPVYNVYHIGTDVWDGYNQIGSYSLDNRDLWGVAFNELDSGMYWSSVADNVNEIHVYQKRFDRNLNFTDTINFRWPVGMPHLQYQFIYGPIAHSDTAGHYLAVMCQFNVDTGDLSNIRLDAIRTNDYFRTYTYANIFHNTYFLNETSPAYLGGGKYGAWSRLEDGGTLYYFESSDWGASWTNQGYADSLKWYVNTVISSPYAFRATNDSVHILYGNRDNDFIEISPFNKPSIFFGGSHFNSPELYYYNQSEDHLTANTSLNYPSIVNIKGDSIYLIAWSHEKTADTAFILYARDNLKTDPSGAPVAPPTIASSNISPTSFRIDITGYTREQLDNIRAFEFDLSTASNFSSFVTAEYWQPSIDPGNISLHNKRMNSLWDIFNSLTPNTTYYLRIRAWNYNGFSSYTTINVTTSAL